jgi:hypothetical protein
MENDNGFSRLRSSSDRVKSRLFSACAGLFTLGAAVSADAALVSRLNGAAVYDTDLNITWIADANLAVSNQFGVTSGIILTGSASGQMTWTTAQNWIAGMNAANYLGYNDWRLPITVPPDPNCSVSQTNAIGSNCTGSEMGHLFYSELSGTAGSNITTSGDPDLAKFQNIWPSYYWSTDYTPTSATGDAYDFNFNAGDQGGVAKGATNNVWAVRTGDVAVPLPAAGWLLASGLIGMFGFSRKNRADFKPAA